MLPPEHVVRLCGQVMLLEDTVRPTDVRVGKDLDEGQQRCVLQKKSAGKTTEKYMNDDDNKPGCQPDSHRYRH